jgi:hypothetical protein
MPLAPFVMFVMVVVGLPDLYRGGLTLPVRIIGEPTLAVDTPLCVSSVLRQVPLTPPPQCDLTSVT